MNLIERKRQLDNKETDRSRYIRPDSVGNINYSNYLTKKENKLMTMKFLSQLRCTIIWSTGDDGFYNIACWEGSEEPARTHDLCICNW